VNDPTPRVSTQMIDLFTEVGFSEKKVESRIHFIHEPRSGTWSIVFNRNGIPDVVKVLQGGRCAKNLGHQSMSFEGIGTANESAAYVH